MKEKKPTNPGGFSMNLDMEELKAQEVPIDPTLSPSPSPPPSQPPPKKKTKKKNENPEINGNGGRIVFTLISLGFIFWFPVVFCKVCFQVNWIGFPIGIALVSYCIPYFMVSVPEVCGLLTINLKNSELRAYGTGVHFRYPWEQVKKGNFINMRLITKTVEEDYPTANGPVLKVKWSFQYRPTLEGLVRYIAVDESTINDGFVHIGSSFFGSQLINRSAEENKANVKELEEKLQASFEDDRFIDDRELARNIEDLYGVNLIEVSLAIVDYEDNYQKVKTSEAVAEKIKDIASNLKEGDISYKDAKNLALIINGDVKKHVQEVEGEGGKALAGLLMAMANAKSGGGKKK